MTRLQTSRETRCIAFFLLFFSVFPRLASADAVDILSVKNNCTFPTHKTLQATADYTFCQLSSMIENCASPTTTDASCNYWQLGNTFNTVIDYFNTNNSQSSHFAGTMLSVYNNTPHLPGPACWFDDYGWWSTGSLAALQHTTLWTPEQNTALHQVSMQNWTALEQGANVWDLCQYHSDCKKQFADLAPKFQGGVWNTTWAKTPYDSLCNNGNKACDPTDPSDNANPLCGYQNTVTNGLFLVTAMMEWQAHPNDPWMQEQALREYQFLMNWMEYSDPTYTLIHRINHGALAREHVGLYANGHVDLRYDPDLSWAGDQGLLLGGVVSTLQANTALSTVEANRLLRLASDLIIGAPSAFYDATAQEWLPWTHCTNQPGSESCMGTPPGHDPWDYNTGTSVFMHYLLYAYHTEPALRRVIHTHLQNDILTAAHRLMVNPNQGLCFPGNECTPLVLYTNQLAILVAAIELTQQHD